MLSILIDINGVNKILETALIIMQYNSHHNIKNQHLSKTVFFLNEHFNIHNDKID